MKIYGVIYKTTNLVNKKTYIGQHTKPYLGRYLGSGKILHNAIKKYGKENFKTKIIDRIYYISREDIAQKKLDKKEQYWIKYYRKKNKAEYNIDNGGFGHGKFSERTLRKMSRIAKKNGRGIEKGCRHWTNGKEEKFCKERPGKDWYIGLIYERGNSKGFHYYHRGNKTIFAKEKPKGWKEGRWEGDLKKFGAKNKGKPSWNKGLKITDPEELKRISERAREGFKNSKKQWYNNGVITKKFLKHPGKGWHKGRILPESARLKMIETKRKNPYHPSEEARKKLSDILKGRVTSEKTKRKLSRAHKGKIISEETRKKISDTLKGRTMPKKIRDKISKTMRKKYAK